MNNKLIYSLVAVILVVLLGVGGFFVVKSKTAAPAQPEDEGQMEVVPTINPTEIGMSLEPKGDKKNVKLVIANLKGVKHIDYEITYDADSKDPEAKKEGVRVPRGFDDEKDVTDESEKFESKWYFLGSCSSGVCLPDLGVSTIKATVKVTKTDGKVYQSETSLDL